MIGVIIAGHGSFASAIISTAERTLGKQEHLEAVSMKVGEAEGALHNKLKSVLKMAEIEDVIVLADIYGSSFSKACIYMAKNQEHVADVTGVNLPMVLRVLTYRDKVDLPKLVSLACEGGRDGIRDACGFLKDS